MLRFLTAGESHGPALTVVIEGMPAGLPLTAAMINHELARRQVGFGRGERMQIERDRVTVVAGLRHGQTLGSPLAFILENRDWAHWTEVMAPENLATSSRLERMTRPRPGHADLAGALKYDRQDLRDILERASARETAARVMVGAVAKVLLKTFNIQVGSWVEVIGSAHMPAGKPLPAAWVRRAEKSDVRCPHAASAAAMRAAIKQAAGRGDTLGGIFTVTAWGVLPGLGSHVHWDRRLDMRIAGALMSIPAIKGVEWGLGFAAARLPGSKVHDAITLCQPNAGGRYGRKTNHAGGVEGGISTGQPLLIRAAMKPIATLKKPLATVDMATRRAHQAGYERSDVCAVPAAAVVGEAMVAIELAGALMEKIGGDSISEMMAHYQSTVRALARR